MIDDAYPLTTRSSGRPATRTNDQYRNRALNSEDFRQILTQRAPHIAVGQMLTEDEQVVVPLVTLRKDFSYDQTVPL